MSRNTIAQYCENKWVEHGLHARQTAKGTLQSQYTKYTEYFNAAGHHSRHSWWESLVNFDGSARPQVRFREKSAIESDKYQIKAK